MYEILLISHNILRWAVLLLGFWAAIQGYVGWLGKKEWSEVHRKPGMWFTIALDLQFLLGLVLTVISPLVQSAVADLSTVMVVPEFRSILVEHIPIMLLALAAGHLTSALSRRAETDLKKHRRAAIGYTITLLLILVVTPWGRPLLRGLF
jgi:uncharacterized BrkB/YihY/UPF0761 family membrane protein